VTADATGYIAGSIPQAQDDPMEAPTAALLQEAARLHGQGALAEAASRYRQVLESEPDHAGALYHLAVIWCQQGQFQKGIELARRSLASNSRQPRALNLLGMALSRLGQQQEALASFDEAIIQQADFADAYGNRASALMELGHLAEAVASYERAVALQPASVGDWLNLGTALHRLGRHDDALASYDRVLALHANFPEAHFNRGKVLAHLARHEESLASYDRALALNRRYPEALTARGQLLLALGRVEGALVNLEEALALAPHHLAMLHQLVDLLIARGEVARALAAVMRSLAVEESSEAKALFVQCLQNRRLTADPGGVRALLTRALSEPWDRPADLAGPAISLVKLNPAVRDACARAAGAWPKRLAIEDLSGRLTAIVDDQLLRALLETVPLCDVELERCITGMRSIFLDAAGEGPATPTEDGLLRFCCALARQCFINEYVFDATPEELKRVAQLHDRLARAIASGGTVPVLWLVAVAAYLPLHALEGVDGLLGRSWSPAVAALLTQQVAEPREERCLRDSIPRLTAITNAVSLAVKQQYEENPYPRWVRPAPVGEPKSMTQYFGGWFEPRSDQADSIDVLVAGCGTGQNLVETARQFTAAQVLAVDLSRASLCYAKRQTTALGLTNIEFAEADIGELAGIGRTFDVVDASGVLHHMADPWAGWRVLLSLLRPGRFMRLGFYSKLARVDVNAARAFVATRGFASTAPDIRRSRQEILALPDGEAARGIARYLDFFTTSECRDMLFHAQEHQTTLPEIAGFIADSNIEFLGFVTDAQVLRRFQKRFPQDQAAANLDHWHIFETEHPETFAGMYQFWIRKNDAG
jgi:tetratricopeptide (TPR) repeat protein/SAM-dependent methyltransferase